MVLWCGAAELLNSRKFSYHCSLIRTVPLPCVYRYIDRLARLLSAKSDAIGALRSELNTFQLYRAAMC
jgi:hypothetical protein